MQPADAHQTAVAVQSFFRDRLVGTRYVSARRRGPNLERGRRNDCFRIGSTRRADAPAAEALIGGPEHALVTVDGGGAAVLHLTPRMMGQMSLPEGTQALAGTVTIADGSSAEVRCGAMTFRIAATEPLTAVDVAPPRWQWQTQRYAVAVALATVAVAGVMAFIPPDRKALSLDFDSAAEHLDKYLIRAPEVPAAPPAAGAAGSNDRARESAPRGAASSDPGTAGRPDARKTPRPTRLAIKGDSPRFELRESPAPVTLVSLIGRSQSAMVRSIFSRGQALGPDADTVLGTLQGDPSQSPSWGLGGMGTRGTGARDAGEGDGIIGVVGPLTSIGPGRRNGGPPRGIGDPSRLPGPPRPIVPEIRPGVLAARGSLDKEIIRRIIRAHINEVRYCYEQELPRHPTLNGRIVVQFAITPTGQVASSAIQESTLHLASLEGCMTQAVRRWTFPQPQGGGLTIVSYPFVLSPAGG